jgi:2-keto-4-pentenoate hydratase/2-oxohepta-3-ene-1,7-dioic acid hydratase in catechol pathway
MRLATIVEDGRFRVAVVDAGELRLLPAGSSIRALAAGEQPVGPTATARPMEGVRFGPVVPDPGAIYTVGLNYRDPAMPTEPGPERPMIFGKATSSVAGHGAQLRWDRSVTATVDPECELGLVMGVGGAVFGYTIVNDISSRDPWLEGSQWLLGKSMPGFCPVGPWLVTADELPPDDVRLGSTINDVAIQDGRTSDMHFPIPAILDYLSRHLELRPGDLIATGTPPRLAGPMGPERHLEPGDVVTAWIEGIGELTTRIE